MLLDIKEPKVTQRDSDSESMTPHLFNTLKCTMYSPLLGIGIHLYIMGRSYLARLDSSK